MPDWKSRVLSLVADIKRQIIMPKRQKTSHSPIVTESVGLACREAARYNTKMNFRVLLICFFFSLSTFANDSVPKLEVLKRLPHSGYSEGLDFYQGYLWHAVPKKILKIDPKDGTVLSTFAPPTAHSESLVWFQGKLWNVSYSDNGIYVGTLENGKLKFAHKGTTVERHAWGLVTDGRQIIMTGDHDSNKIYFYDPKTVKKVREIEVSISNLEDLAWDGEGLWTSSFTSHPGQIFRVNPANGKVEGIFSLPNPAECPVIDGIATQGETLWITGKECPTLYQVKLPKIREVTSGKKPR